MGRSIGTGPSTRAAAQLCSRGTPCAGLVLISPFVSVRKLAKEFVGGLANIISDRFPNHTEITQVTCPVFFLHGQADTVIPVQSSQKLYRRCPSQFRTLRMPPKATHDHFQFEEDLLEPLMQFFIRFLPDFLNDEVLVDASCVACHSASPVVTPVTTPNTEKGKRDSQDEFVAL